MALGQAQSVAVELKVSGLTVPSCVHSHEIPEKAHSMLLSQACYAILRTMKRVRRVHFPISRGEEGQNYIKEKTVATKPLAV